MIDTFSGYLNLLRSQGKDPDAVYQTVSKLEAEFMIPVNFKSRTTGLLCGHVQSGKTSHVLGVLAKAVDLGVPLIIYLTTDNVSLYSQTYKDCMQAVGGKGAQVLNEEGNDIIFSCSSTAVVVLKKNSVILQKWVEAIQERGFRSIFIIDDEADASSLDTNINTQQDPSVINSYLRTLKQLGQEGSLFLQLTATPQANLLLPDDDPLKPTYWASFKPGSGYKGGTEIYLDPNCISIINDGELSALRSHILPAGLENAFIYYVRISSEMSNAPTKTWARMLVHPDSRTSIHNSTKVLLENLRQKLIIEVEEAIAKNSLPESFVNNLKVVTSKQSEILPNVLLETLKNLSIIVFNSKEVSSPVFDNSPQPKPLEQNQVLIGGNILGRGLRVPNLQVVYYCRTTKKPQFDTVWQHSRVFGYDRDLSRLKIFVDKSVHFMLASLAESTNALMRFIDEGNPISNVSLRMLHTVAPTRHNVIPRSQYTVLMKGEHYFTRNIEEYVQDFSLIEQLLSNWGISNNFSALSAESVRQILDCIQGDPILTLASDAIATYFESDVVMIRALRGKKIMDNYNAVLSQTEQLASKNASADKFVISICELLPAGRRDKPYWVVVVRAPFTCAYSKTINI